MIESDEIIKFFYVNQPRKIWEIDELTFSEVRQLKDSNGRYLWSPEPIHMDMPGTFLGIPVSIAKDKCFQLRHLFPNGESHIIKYDG